MKRADDEEEQPEGRRDIAHDAHEQMKAVCRAKPLGEKQPAVLRVALAPAPIALRAFNQRWRALLVRTLDVTGEPHAPACLAHERSLDEVMAQNPTAEGLASGQVRQRAMVDERLHAND